MVFGFFKKRVPGQPFDLTQFLIITAISIVLVSILSGILGIWIQEFAQVSQQVGMGVLLLVIMAAVIIAFMVIRRQLSGAGMSTKDLFFVILIMAFVVFLMIVVPRLFNLPDPFQGAMVQLQSIVALG